MYCIQCRAILPDMLRGENQLRCGICGHVIYGQPSPCVSILIVSGNNVLLGLRGDTQIKPGKWCLPCGHIERDEDFICAAAREVLEETNLHIQPISVINVVTNHFANDIHSLVVVLLARPSSADLKAGDDLAQAAWFPIDRLYPDMAFQADIHIIEQYRKYGASFGIPLSQTRSVFFEP